MKLIFNGEEFSPSEGGGGTVMLTLILPVGNWDAGKRQTISAPGVLADEAKQLIQIAPSSACRAAYDAAGVRCVEQGADNVTMNPQTLAQAICDRDQETQERFVPCDSENKETPIQGKCSC